MVDISRTAGVPVYVHATFALLLLWVGVVHWTAVACYEPDWR